MEWSISPTQVAPAGGATVTISVPQRQFIEFQNPSSDPAATKVQTGWAVRLGAGTAQLPAPTIMSVRFNNIPARSWRVNGGNLEVLTPLAGPVYGEHTSPVYPNVKNPYNFVTVQIITVDATGVQDTKVITDKLQYLPDCGCDDDCTPFTGFIADPRNCPSPTVVTSFSSAAADNCCQRTPAGQPEYFRCPATSQCCNDTCCSPGTVCQSCGGVFSCSNPVVA